MAKRTSTKANGHGPLTFDQLVSVKKPARRRIELVLDSEVAEELKAAQAEVSLAEMQAKDARSSVALKKARERVEKAEKAAEAVTVTVALRSIGRGPYEALQRAHRPRPEDKKEGLEFHAETFPPALIAACAEEPAMTLEQATELWNSENWAHGELTALFLAAATVNETMPRVNR